jgi:hypothetical protein
LDLSPRSLARLLPLLAAVLAIEVLVSLTPPFTGLDINFGSCLQALFHVPHAALLLGFAIAIPVMTRGGATRTACQRLLYGGFAAVAATALAQFMDIYFNPAVSRPWLVLQGLGNVLMNAAAPGLWGAAIARRQNLQDPRLPRVARIFGLTALAGLTLYFVCDLAKLIAEGPVDVWKGTTGMLLISTLTLLLARGSLLWASVESCRTSPDEAVTLSRSDLIQGLVFGWLIGSGLAWLCTLVVRLSDEMMGIWHVVVQGTLLLTVTILVALALEQPEQALEPRPKGPLFPEPPPPADNSPIDVP